MHLQKHDLIKHNGGRSFIDACNADPLMPSKISNSLLTPQPFQSGTDLLTREPVTQMPNITIFLYTIHKKMLIRSTPICTEPRFSIYATASESPSNSVTSKLIFEIFELPTKTLSAVYQC